MKKLSTLILALLMVVSLLAACGGSEAPENDVTPPETTAATDPVETDPVETEPEETEPVETEPEATQDNSAAVAAFVETYGEEFLGGLESSFAASAGSTCTSTIQAVGNGIEVRINIDGLDNVPEENKQVLQQTYDALSDSFAASLTALQTQEPAIASMTIYVCEQDGDVLATIAVG